GVYIQAGQRLPLAPPLGAVFVAWSDEATIERWLSKLGAPPKKATADHFRRAVRSVRTRGYSVGVEGSRRPRRARTATAGGLRARLDLARGLSAHDLGVLAPVVDPDRRPERHLLRLRSDRLAARLARARARHHVLPCLRWRPKVTGARPARVRLRRLRARFLD